MTNVLWQPTAEDVRRWLLANFPPRRVIIETMSLSLPVDLAKGDVTRTASTPSEYWSLRYSGFAEEFAEENLSPQQKAARTRAANKAKEEVDTSTDAVDADLDNQAGDANES